MTTSLIPQQGNPGDTVSVTLADNWQKLAVLISGAGANTIFWPRQPNASSPGNPPNLAMAILLSAVTNGAQICFSELTPSGATVGHPINVNDTQRYAGMDWVRKAYVRNGTAGSNAILVVTGEFQQ
jgi:hypothetical protein